MMHNQKNINQSCSSGTLTINFMSLNTGNFKSETSVFSIDFSVLLKVLNP